MLIKTEIKNTPDNHRWFDLQSDTVGKAVFNPIANKIYRCATIRDDDPIKYEECDDPNYDTNEIHIKQGVPTK